MGLLVVVVTVPDSVARVPAGDGVMLPSEMSEAETLMVGTGEGSRPEAQKLLGWRWCSETKIWWS